MIYRRGPTKQTCLIAWDRTNDTFTIGQWFKGSVYPERCDLSPDGSLLLTFMGTFKGPFRTWTVLSQPPFYTALSLWPKGDTWGGGGFFLSDQSVMLDHAPHQMDLAPGFAAPPGLAVHPATSEIAGKLDMSSDRMRPWPPSMRSDEPVVKQGSDGIDLACLVTRGARTWSIKRIYSIVIDGRAYPLDGAGWANVDANGDILFAIAGSLYRLAARRVTDPPVSDDVRSRATCIADFSDLVFQSVVAPYHAAGGEASQDFGPRLDRVSKEDRRRRVAARKTAKQRG